MGIAADTVCVIIVILSTAGLINSLYFTMMSFGVLPPDFSLAPRVCRPEGSACAHVLHTRYAKVFGTPNSVIGIVFYILTAAVCLERWLLESHVLLPYALVASLISVGFSAYLADALLNKLRVKCVLCFISHAINLVLAFLVAVLVMIT